MKLTINGIGKVQSASIEINGITVIAGENNTGKSTIGKALYSTFNSFYHLSERMRNEKEIVIQKILNRVQMDSFVDAWSHNSVDVLEISKEIVKNIDFEVPNAENVKASIVRGIESQYHDLVEQNKEKFDTAVSDGVEKIIKVLKISDEELINTILTQNFRYEFNGQINNLFHDCEGKICLEIQGKKSAIEVRDNVVTSVSETFQLGTRALYLDDPQVLDMVGAKYIYYTNSYLFSHAADLQRSLGREKRGDSAVQEILTSDKLNKIYEKLGEVCSGDFVKNQGETFGYRLAGTDKFLYAENLSDGLKTFVIVKTLLQNGSLEENGTLILDEPEIHLHPEWQLLFAELIVLLQKEFGLHILLNTHSPYFLNAIEVYAAKYEISEKCKYYLANLKEGLAHVGDVTGNLEAIYSKLARPLQDLENERYS